VLRAHTEQLGLEVPEEWVFEDEGPSGATLVRPALERLRDLVARVGSTWSCAVTVVSSLRYHLRVIRPAL
jgi:hypothetical protein